MKQHALRRFIGLTAGLALLGVAAAGCGSDDSEGSSDSTASSATGAATEPASGSATVGVSMINMRDPDLVVMSDSMQAAADASGTELVLLDTTGDVAKELSLIEDLIIRKPSAVVMQPLDGTASQAAAKRVNEAGIPLFTLSTEFAEGNSLDIESYIGVDDTEAGRMQAEYVNEQLPDGGKVIYIVGTYGASWTDRRKSGFEEVVNDNIEIAAEVQANGSRDEGKRVMEDLLSRFATSGEISGLICHNDEMCIGAASAIEEAGRASEFTFVVAVDGTPAGLDAVRAGAMTATVRQDSAAQGTTTVQVVDDFLAGKPIEERYYLPFVMVTKDNVDSL